MLMSRQSFEELESGACRPPAVGDRRRNCELDFRSRARLAPHIASRPYLLCSLSNTEQPPVAGSAALLQHLRIHASSIVPHPQPKLVFGVENLGLDSLRLGVPECIP